MKLRPNLQRTVAVALLASLAIGTIAPAAWAEHSRRWKKHHRRGPVVQRVVEVRRSDSFGPVFAGIIGGLALGAAIGSAHAHDGSGPAVHAGHYYWYPYCGGRYASLGAYRHHLRHGCRHPHVVRVISVSSGDCVRSLRYHRGDWCEVGRDARGRCDHGDRWYDDGDDDGYYEEDADPRYED